MYTCIITVSKNFSLRVAGEEKSGHERGVERERERERDGKR